MNELNKGVDMPDINLGDLKQAFKDYKDYREKKYSIKDTPSELVVENFLDWLEKGSDE